MSEIKDFLETLGKDPKAKELLKGLKEPANTEEAAEQYLVIAEKLGCSVTKESILGFLKKKEMFLRANAAKAESAIKEALEEEKLESVAGGKQEGANPGCESSFSPGEWCWFSDSCSVVINAYTGDALNKVAPNPSADCPQETLTFNSQEYTCFNGKLGDGFELEDLICQGNPESCESVANNFGS